MKYFNLIKVSLILSIATFFSCKQEAQFASSSVSALSQSVYNVSLNDAVFLKDNNTFNLHWDSNIPLEKVSYSILINEKLYLSDVSKTIVNDIENTIEFNVPQLDFSLDNSKLISGMNNIQIEALYDGQPVAKSNVISIDNTEETYLASR